MNILVQPYGSAFWICRPDTTWEKDNGDFFPPESFKGLAYSPILFAKISKPGKVIGVQFAPRYFEAINYGILLYPEDVMNDGIYGFSQANCIDHTSFLPAPLYNKTTLGRQGNEFRLCKNGTVIFSYDRGSASVLDKAVSEASALTYLRIGDMVAVELAPTRHLMSRDDGNVGISGSFCGNWLLEFNIIV